MFSSTIFFKVLIPSGQQQQQQQPKKKKMPIKLKLSYCLGKFAKSSLLPVLVLYILLSYNEKPFYGKLKVLFFKKN